MDNYKIEDLHNFVSKHSHYQTLYEGLEKYFDISKFNVKKMAEKERLEFMEKKLSFENQKIMDIGGNTGYFTFSLANKGAKEVIYYEGNSQHSEFVKIATDLLKFNEIVQIKNEYFSFDESIARNPKVDIVLLLNVLHHLGDDYGNSEIKSDDVLENIAAQLNCLAAHTKYLVFQMGYNWKGDIHKPLFKNGTIDEQIKYIEASIHGYWKIESIGIANDSNSRIEYEEATPLNRHRKDHLGEFLNRPIFILKSTKY